MDIAIFNTNELPKTIKRGGQNYLIACINNEAWIFSNDDTLDGMCCSQRPDEYQYSWVGIIQNQSKKAIFSGLPNNFISLALAQKTVQRLKTLCSTNGFCYKSIYNNAGEQYINPAWLTDLRKKISEGDNQRITCCYSGRVVSKSMTVETVDGRALYLYGKRMLMCAESHLPFLPNGTHIETDRGFVHERHKPLYDECLSCGVMHRKREGDLCTQCQQSHYVCGGCREIFVINGDETIRNEKRYCCDCADNLSPDCECCGAALETPKHITACRSCARRAIRIYSEKFPSREYPSIRYGVEMEVCTEIPDFDSEPDNAQVAYALYEKIRGVAMIKSDSSINYGFEIVTKPLRYDKALEECARILSIAEGYGCRSDSSCGIHIHVSRKFLSSSDIARIIFIFSEMEHDVVKIARRNSDEWARIAKYQKNEMYDTDDVLENERCSRYRAVNLKNSATIEFRVFSSTTSQEVIKAYIQFIECVVSYAKSHTLDEIEGKSVRDIIAGKEESHASLMRYLKQLNIIN